MATAAELLAAGTEEHIVIGTDRRIKIPVALKRLAVQFDHDIETVTFDCPRYWDDHDMSKMAVYINYMRSDGYKDRYPAGNVRVDGDIMHFDWTISRNVTEVVGVISFLICVMKTDAQGNEERHWNSELSQEAYVSEGMECEESPVDMYPDLITQLLLRMDSVEQINIQADEMQSLYDATVEAANTAEQVKNEALDASDYIKNSYAPAIKGNVSGEIVRVDDVSPIEHGVKCRVRGKNLFDVSKIFTTDASTSVAYVSEVGSDYIIVTTEEGYAGNGFCTVSIKLKDVCPGLEVGKTYVLNANTESNSSNIYFPGILQSWVFGTTKVMTEELLNSALTFYGLSTLHDMGTGDCRISNIQIEEGPVATAYEPYIDPTTVKVTGCGKNIYKVLSKTQTLNGVTFTVNTDGSVIATGTATKSTYVGLGRLQLKPGVKYRLSGGPSDSKLNTYILYIHNNTTGSDVIDQGKGKVFTGEEGDLGVTIAIYAGNTVNNLIFRPMVVHGEEVEEFEPYTGSTFTPSSDGTCTVTSKSPTMTLFTDTPGVTVEAEYNRDTTKMFESYVLTDDAKSEIAALVEADMAEVLAALNEYTEALIGGDA